MTPSLPIATDNIYKFTCLFGLALIVVAIFSFVSMYSASLERKVKYMEVVILLEAKEQRSKADDDLLEMNKKLLEIAKSNEKAGNTLVSAILGIGIALSAYGAFLWHGKIQLRDDKLAQLQIEKLEVEISKLQGESASTSTTPLGAVSSEENRANDSKPFRQHGPAA
ncbi:MAG TPA: hypothetical protein VFP33_06520 [Gallionella sp.]|nr:hypothetical protein [Gallionella sp.]